MIEIKDKKNCCGCGGCMNVCPQHCITMKADNEGFLYPEINKDVCTNCHLCEKVCPVLNCQPEVEVEQTAYLLRNNNETILKESTSGGAFTAIARYILDRDGLVFGAAYDEDFRVNHIYITNSNELWKFRNSKYVQSDTKNSFSLVEGFLKKGKMVCYSGTPCQIEGLKLYLRREYDNLFTVDIVCHAVPSPLIWEIYKNYRAGNEKTKLVDARFRDKSKYGYQYSQIKLEYMDGKTIYCGVESDPYLRAFFGNLSDRPICYSCPFKKRYRMSDLTIWDCFDVYRFCKKYDDNSGVTRVLTHSKKGKELINGLYDCSMTEIDPNDAVQNVKEMFESVSKPVNREVFFDDALRLNEKQFVEKWFPDSFKVKINRTIRKTCEYMGIYRTMKRIARIFIGKE